MTFWDVVLAWLAWNLVAPILFVVGLAAVVFGVAIFSIWLDKRRTRVK